MTHFQEVFIKNLRFYRTEAGFSQLAFSEKINLSPNYLNAVENGKNFPSPDVIQNILDVLHLMPYQLFLENPDISEKSTSNQKLIQIANELKQKISFEIDETVIKFSN
ncbi:helix-turn-helix domain-containing protein [Treponema sp.]|uniref:helix-turn-helix domain-containing protein n=1 Tax=Treponema sp. TaxID=166 RepID=UPI003F066DEF